MYATEDQKKAIRAVLECRETYKSEPDALDAAEAAVAKALGLDAKQSENMLDELQYFDWVEMDTRSQGDEDRITWRVTDEGRAELGGAKGAGQG